MQALEYEYPGKNSEKFHFGPASTQFKRGEITFVTGGNGSGKSTLAKLLLGLYRPSAGSIYLGDQKIDNHNLLHYRAMFSAIFVDFHLFDQILPSEKDTTALVNYYLKQLNLQDKVSIEDGRLSTTKLSQGQRRRLALMMSFLDKKPVCVFDEWAADQDPLFRDVFYRKILRALAALKKVVIVISHDSAYFKYADRIIQMDYGKVREKKVARS